MSRKQTTPHTFPSPMGIMSVSILTKALHLTKGDRVSVPYGDHVCLNYIMTLISNANALFPSPMGIMSVSIGLLNTLLPALLVSVPYGDHVCLNTDTFICRKTGMFPSPMGIMSVSIDTSCRVCD